MTMMMPSYGGSSNGPEASTSNAAKAGASAPIQDPSNPPISLHENASASVANNDAEGDGEKEMDEGSDDEEEEESDDDLEIILDINPNNAPSSHHDFARRTGAVPVRQPPVQQPIQNASPAPQPQQPRLQSLQPNGSPSRASPGTASTQLSGPPVPPSFRSSGTPVPAPQRDNPPDPNSTSGVYSQTSPSVEPDGQPPLDFKPIVQPIIDTDLESIEDKKWRKPGAHLSDYFNYGFDEKSWLAWCRRQKESRDERKRERENPFHVFANRPLPEAWQSLPMELKGLMMQTIMSSFQGGGASGGGMMPGMMGGPGGNPGGMNMPPHMQGMNPMMGGMGGNAFMQQQGQQAQQPGGGGGGMDFSGPGGMNMPGAGGMNMGMMGQMGGMQQGNHGGSGAGTPNPSMMMQQRGR